MSTCNINLNKEDLPKLISKVEFFIFRALEKQGMKFYELTGKNKLSNLSKLINLVKDSVIPEYINDYITKAAILKKEGRNEDAEEYQTYATNLQNMLVLWDQIIPNFVYYTDVFTVKNKFSLTDDGLVDTSASEDFNRDYKQLFDQSPNEVDPLDTVDKSVELFLRSLVLPEADNYGFTVGVNYSSFVAGMISDIKNTTSLEEIISVLNKNKSKVPQYEQIVNKLVIGTDNDADNLAFNMAFRRSFMKAFIPIYMVSIEKLSPSSNNVIKVFEAANGKRSFFEQVISTNFLLKGMPVRISNDVVVNMAEEVNGIWQLNKNSISKLQAYINDKTIDTNELARRQIEVLKGIGFEFTEESIKQIKALGYVGGKPNNKFSFIFNHLLNLLSYKEFISNPYKDLKQTNVPFDKAIYGTGSLKGLSQNNSLLEFIQVELKNNRLYNVQNTIINSEGNMQNTVQDHNNFTIVNKALSDFDQYPTLQSILEKEPSFFWMNPEINPAIRSSLIMNSLFYFDPNGENYGKRKRVFNNPNAKNKLEFTADDKKGIPVQLSIVNTGGVQSRKVIDDVIESSAASSTSLSDMEKLLQDMNSFFSKGYNSVLRLSDKSTDLGIMLNYYEDPISKKPITRPLLYDEDKAYDIFKSEEFSKYIRNALKDIIALKWLHTKGFLTDRKISNKNISNSFSYLDKVLSFKTKENINKIISQLDNPDNIDFYLDSIINDVNKDTINYFNSYYNKFYSKVKPITRLISSYNLFNKSKVESLVKSYLANSFITDLEQLKVFFGDSVFFKQFHKRSSKDSATGAITILEDNIVNQLNNNDEVTSPGFSTNLNSKLLVDRLFRTNQISFEEWRTKKLEVGTVSKAYNSAVLADVIINPHEKIKKFTDNIEKLYKENIIDDKQYNLFNKSIKTVIEEKYLEANEADGQGKCTLDFYRTISILTNQWSWDEQEAEYRKIIMYDYYDRLADGTTDESLKSSYIKERDAVGYNPIGKVYFPPKKFQYSGTEQYNKVINGVDYGMMVPIFDKFSLQPLIPTITKNKPDDHLLQRMLYNNIGYVKYESGSKTEIPIELDSVYENFDSNTPNKRIVKQFSPADTFKSKQTLFFNHLKEQVTIEADIHDSAVFGSQIRKLIMMNISHSDMQKISNNYNKLISDITELEKTSLYNDLGIEKSEGKLVVKDLEKLVNYFLTEIDKKNQDVNVRKALKYDSQTKKFDISLDAAVQAQVIEGIILSAINNRIVRYKTNGSMLVQVSNTGNEYIKYDKSASELALSTFGNDDLKFYDLESKNGKTSVKAMEVKISLAGQWLKLLELTHPDGYKINTLNRLNEALKNEEWKNKHSKSIRMVAYRIPTQGRNFSDVMEIKEFLPSHFGDAIIMPSEIVVKSGSDFDIDKMFVFYPNLDSKGNYISYDYENSVLYEDLEKKKDDAVFELKHLKLYRKMSLPKLQEEFYDAKSKYLKERAKDTAIRNKLNNLIKQVEIGLAFIDTEKKNINKHLEKIIEYKQRPDYTLDQIISDSIIFNLDEYEDYKRKYNINVLSPSVWIDTKRRGLEYLLSSLKDLKNTSLDESRNELKFTEESLSEFKEEIGKEIEIAEKRLYQVKNIKGNLQNKLYETMVEAILHPVNYMELITPSDNFLIMPVIDDIYKRLGKPVDKEGKHIKTDFLHTDILNREVNLDKYLSLLKGKSDLGIAALANTFNVLLQLSKGQINIDFIKKAGLSTYFNSNSIKKENGEIKEINLYDIYDDDGNLKSEFFAEFISAFVDVAKDDYVFAVNVLTELSPIIFYLKYQGISTDKILYFINQPIIRSYLRNIRLFDNQFLKTATEEDLNVRKKALEYTLFEFGIDLGDKKINKKSISEYLNSLKLNQTQKEDYFVSDVLKKQITPDDKVSSLSKEDKKNQVIYILELLNLKEQTDSLREIQGALNFDTKTYESGFDVYSREKIYSSGMQGNYILTPKTIEYIHNRSMISSLNVADDVKFLLQELLPIRNNIEFNNQILKITQGLRSNFDNKSITTQEDEMRFARTAKNDYINYIFQNFFDKSTEGKEFFKREFNTDKNVNEYLLELVSSNQLKNDFKDIKDLVDYDKLLEVFPFVNNIVMEMGEKNKNITNFKILKSSNNAIDKNSIIYQYENIISIDASDEDLQKIQRFFKNLALFSIYQSGLNTSDISFIDLTPISLTNKLYSFAINEYYKLNDVEKSEQIKNFFKLFGENNPSFYGKNSKNSIIGDVNKRGKWYYQPLQKQFKIKLSLISKGSVYIANGTTEAKKAARELKFIYSMRPNPGDNIPGVNENFHFGNPWSHAGYQGTISTGSLSEAEAEQNPNWKGTVKDTAVSIAADNYEKWLKGEAFQDVEPERRKWIIDLVNSGRLDGKSFIYFKGGYRSHADILVDFINNRENKTTDESAAADPLTAAGVKPSDMYGNAAKDIEMAKKATQFIGKKSGDASVSSTDKYRQAWGNKANTGVYSVSDTVMISGSGLFRGVTADQIKSTLSSFYKPLIEAAISAGAKFVVGNQYTKGNLSDELVHKYLISKGYTETRNNGWSLYTPGKATGNNVITEVEKVMADIPFNWEMSAGQIAEMYQKEKLSNESVEEFIKRMSCLGKIK